MNYWINFWAVVLAVAAGGFALLAIVVTIGGARDIHRLLGRLREEREHAAKKSENEETT